MNKGDIVLVPFPFTDLSANKNRPAVVLVDSENDVTLCFITTQLKWQSDSDIRISPSEANGLKKPSLIRINKIATVDKDLVVGLLGHLDNIYLSELNIILTKLLKLKETELQFVAVKAWYEDGMICMILSDEKEVRFPVTKNTKLRNASNEQRNNIEIICAGKGLHWPDLDEDLSVIGIMEGKFGY
jgi:mRNA interferase MazF